MQHNIDDAGSTLQRAETPEAAIGDYAGDNSRYGAGRREQQCEPA
ncbi:hypothetical protein A2U01_0098563, partial [Trifolium medium]|nr:hypothetical protein [Trifolium medium]